MKGQVRIGWIWYEWLGTSTKSVLVRHFAAANPFYPETLLIRKKFVTGWRAR